MKTWMLIEISRRGGTHPCSRQHAAYFSKFFSVQPNHLAPNARTSGAIVRNCLAQNKPVTAPCRTPPSGGVCTKHIVLRRADTGWQAHESLSVPGVLGGVPHPHIATVPSSSGASACMAPVRHSGATAAAFADGFPPIQLHMACAAQLQIHTVPYRIGWPYSPFR